MGLRRLLAGSRPENGSAGLVASEIPSEHASAPAEILNGVVEVLERGEVSGWVEVAHGAPPVRVSAWINDTEAQGTWAIPDPKRRSDAEIRMFRLTLNDIWRFTRKGDRLTFRVDGTPLPIASRGMFYVVKWRPGEEPISDMLDQLANGYVFDQAGRLRLSKTLDLDWQARVMGLYDRVNQALERELGYQAFLCYGSLLGAVRTGGFIGHDIDFDTAYLSTRTDGAAAVEELKRLSFALIEAGFDVTARRTCIHIKDASSAPDKVDLFHLYLDGSGNVVFPFGVVGTGKLRAEELGGFQEIPFATSTALVPGNAERVVEHIYGPEWRIPNPGFNWLKERTPQKRQGIVPLEQVEEVYWANFYARNSYTRGSTFCEFVLARTELPQAIADIGCGDGRDAVAFAREGRVVVGVDRSHIAVKHANAKKDDLAAGGQLEFAACDIANGERLVETIAALRDRSPDGRVLFYMRFFLHSISEEDQDSLLTLLRDASQAGDAIAVEFRTDRDAAAKHEHGNHFRRYQNGQAFGQALRERYGFEVVVELEGNGLSPYKGEDPQLYRAVAIRTAAKAS